MAASPWRFRRATDDRLLLGVAGGIGQRIGVDPLVIRIALVVLTLAGGAGLVVYGLGWVLSEDAPPGTAPSEPATLDLRQAAAVGLVALGLTLLLRGAGLWFSDALVWPALIAGTVSAVIWTRSGPDQGSRGRLTESTPARMVLAAVLTFAGLVSFWLIVPDPRRVVVPLAGILVGGGLLVTPLLARIWRNLEAERSQRARQAARDEVAAHLHDSVLQTLALIQRSPEHRRAVTLARTQERELRAWLYGDRELNGPGRSLAAAVDDLLVDVETGYAIDVDHVVVGTVADVDADPHLPALLKATREALVNVAKHAGVDHASLYVEVEDDRVTAFVRDRGRGFDPVSVGDDRHGLRHSIHARLQRHGGGARVTTSPDGTEVECWVPLPEDHDGDHDGDATEAADADVAVDPSDPRPLHHTDVATEATP
ncbi:PspC domain-containing protein [Salsipaludibacter albus]|uniref:ATP-binding protein n=1 Tax=Salsipaludibacter albus TaxID=2849650 RepID=UPI001EE4847E|nr:PspC domain-containing protein [Salsipaludibacter albus]